MTRLSRLIGLTIIGTLSVACADDPCGAELTLKGAICVVRDGGANDAAQDSPSADLNPADGDSDSVVADAANDDGGGGLPSGLGDTCSSQGECTGEADYCALRPGQTTAYCTTQGCADPGGSCPPGYSCLDLSIFEPSLPSICQQN